MKEQPLIERTEVLEVAAPLLAGDDTCFAAVHGGGRVGWYGPFTETIARAAKALAGHFRGAPVFCHEKQRVAAAREAAGLGCGPAGHWAVGVIDCAVWDLRGRLAGKPTAELLSCRPAGAADSVAAYASRLDVDLGTRPATSLADDAYAQGFAFTKWALRQRPGFSPVEEGRRLAEAVNRAAEALPGPFAADALGTWSTASGEVFAAHWAAPALRWLEDPLPEHHVAQYKRLGVRTPLAVGERLTSTEDAGPVLHGIRPAALTLDVVGCGGLSCAVQITRAASEARIPVYPHGRSMIPGIHLAAAFPETVRAVEYRCRWEPRRQRLLREPWTPDAGLFRLPATKGLGITPRRSPR